MCSSASLIGLCLIGLGLSTPSRAAACGNTAFYVFSPDQRAKELQKAEGLLAPALARDPQSPVRCADLAKGACPELKVSAPQPIAVRDPPLRCVGHACARQAMIEPLVAPAPETPPP